MLQTAFDRETNEIIIRGEWFELDRIYFMIERLSGHYGIDSQCLLDGYENTVSILGGLNYEIRHAQSGDRELYVSYNGISEGWIAPPNTPAEQIIKEEDLNDPEGTIEAVEDAIYLDPDIDMDIDEFNELDEDEQLDILTDLNFDIEEAEVYIAWLNRKPTWYFSAEENPGASEKNTYLQFRLPSSEAFLYALILRDLLGQKKTFMKKSFEKARNSENGMADYELLFCRRRMASELLLLEHLMEEIFGEIISIIGDDHYGDLQEALPPIGSFRGMTDSDIKNAEAAVMQHTSADYNSVADLIHRFSQR